MGPLLSARIFLDFIWGGEEIFSAKNNINVSTSVSPCLHVTYTYKMYINLQGILNVHFLNQISH